MSRQPAPLLRTARLPRIDVVGVPQHIVVRGVDRQPCFFASSDRRLYLALLREAAARCGVAVHAYVLMTNHVHLVATGQASGALSAMMQIVGVRYVRRINDAHSRTGTLFEGRFRSSLVQSERYLLACMRYVELNPVRAAMVGRAEDYPWSSYRSNAGFEHAGWLAPSDEYLRLGDTAAARGSAWRDLVAMALGDDELASIRKHVNANRVLGGERFQNELATMLGRRVHILPPGRPWHARDMTTDPSSPAVAGRTS